MRILVTGATGFVGARVVQGLAKTGCQVSTIARKKIASSTVKCHILDHIGPQTDWREILVGCDVVIHLAARVHVMREYSSNPLGDFREVNLHGTANLARQAAQAGVKRLVYVSSVKVNGEYTGPGSVFNESSLPDPQDPYAVSKWEAEQALHAIARETGMEVVIARPPLVYGPGVKANFAKLLSLVDRGIPLPLGGVENARSLIYVDNLADALITCATHPAARETYLVTDGGAVSTPQLIKAISMALGRPNRNFPVPVALMRFTAKLFGKSAAIERLTQSLVIDSSRIRSELGWSPPFTMAQGLKVTADWYRSIKSGGAS